MAKVVHKSYNRNEGSLFPVYLSDMVPAEHPARVVDAVVGKLDSSSTISSSGSNLRGMLRSE